MTDDVPPDPVAVPLEVRDSVVTTAATPPIVDRDAQLAIARDQILASLRERQQIKPPLSYALLGGGLALMIAIGSALSLALYFLGHFIFDNPPGFKLWFFLYLLVLVPFVIWTERRARAGFFTFASGDVDVTRDRDDDEFLLQRGATHVTNVINAIAWPPRAFVAGLHAVRGVPQRGLDMVLPDAADTLTLMLTLDAGVKIKDLAPPETDPMQLMPVLKWLDTHDYIGISTKGDRVWVSSPAKKRFLAEGIRVPKVEVK